jgi:cytochrome oxidase Cu insertion factor (SCO1/SenC/PrrC family)
LEEEMNKKLALTAVAALLLSATAFGQTPSGTLRGTDGRTVAVDQLRGRVTVLMFGGMLDPQSPEELPVLQRLATRYAGRADVYWVSVDAERQTTDAQLTDFAARNGFRGGVLRDASGSVLRSVSTGKPQLPTVVVLDADGALAGRPVAGFDRDADFVNQLAAIVDKLVK